MLDVSTWARLAGFFCHLRLQDVQSAPEGINGLREFPLGGPELGEFFLADFGGIRQLGL